MQINLVDGIFFCYGCGASGDALKFVRLMNPKVDDLKACILYYEILKSKKVKHLKIHHYKKKKKDKLQDLILAKDYYYGLKKDDWQEESEIREYMLERGFYKNTLKNCGAKFNYSKSYPIIFPMYDNGKFRGWVCRTNNKFVEKRRKYLYNDGFVKTNTLVGHYNYEYVIIVEGYMDWLKIRQYGIRNVVAILGWKISDSQVDKLKSAGVKYIISALDNDKCGKKGDAYLKTIFKTVRFQYPKDIKDTGEMNQIQFKKAYHKTIKLLGGIKNG